MHKATPLLALMILCGLVGSNLAYADYTEYINVRIPQNIPNLCIFEAEDPEVRFQERDLYNKTVNWIQEGWIDNLNNYTNSNNWDMTFEYFPNATHFDKKIEDFPQCHLLIVWDAKNISMDETINEAQGYTSFDHSKSTHKWAFIDIFTMAPQNEINLGTIVIGDLEQNEDGSYDIPLNELTIGFEEITDEAIRVVVQHEFGHYLGLGHYFETMKNHYDSIMPPRVDFNAPDEELEEFQITENDLKAVIRIYGEDGLKSYVDPPPERFGYGWTESTNIGTIENGDFLIKFPNIIWLDPNYAQK